MSPKHKQVEHGRVDSEIDERSQHLDNSSGGPIGLGDLIHTVVHPVAKIIDRVAGFDLANCGSCQERRQILNGWMKVNRRKYKGSNW